jgi:fumarylacetoacetase
VSIIIDQTHDAELRSWVASANGHADFPIQNLPLGIFTVRQGEVKPGVAIGDHVLDLAGIAGAGLLHDEAFQFVKEATGGQLNTSLSLGPAPRRALRQQTSALLSENAPQRGQVEKFLLRGSDCTMHMPARIGDYTDFYVGIHHATNIGKQFRPDNPLMPNYKWIPIGYHGRASSVRESGRDVRRPLGQRKAPDAPQPSFGPCQRLDYELELGIWIGSGNDLGNPIGIESAAEHIAGFCLLNDWSARDIQAWEYQPLGPFLAKSFGTTISPWIITPEALAPFRMPQPARSESDPRPLPYLSSAHDQRLGALSIELEVHLSTKRMREANSVPYKVSSSRAEYMYWTAAQLVAHHTSNGCDLRSGDLLGSGTISGPDLASAGALIETTLGGTRPLLLPSGEERRFLEDGDEVMLSARCEKNGFVSIGFGECTGTVLPAVQHQISS